MGGITTTELGTQPQPHPRLEPLMRLTRLDDKPVYLVKAAIISWEVDPAEDQTRVQMVDGSFHFVLETCEQVLSAFSPPLPMSAFKYDYTRGGGQDGAL